MKSIGEVSRLTGVSVRTLHHYDAIGLLKPSMVSESSYRLYDDEALSRLQAILLFRELQFPLKEIRAIMETPGFDPRQALDGQIELLEMKKRRLEEIIALARRIRETGGISMDFSAFDHEKIDRWSEEAKARWGGTSAWKEYEQKTQGKSKKELHSAGDGLMDIFREMGRLLSLSPESNEAQALIQKLCDYVTAHFYTCTPEILRGLGQMYAAEGEMKDNIDAAGGQGTADFAHRAIEVYVTKQ